MRAFGGQQRSVRVEDRRAPRKRETLGRSELLVLARAGNALGAREPAAALHWVTRGELGTLHLPT